MILKVVSLLIVALVLFMAYVSTRDGHFRYERSGLMKAAPETIYPYLSDLKKGDEWSPYSKKDPNMKKTFSGDGTSVGSVYEFEGNSEVGAGKIEILKLVPNQSATLKLTMLKPFRAENEVEYKLVPEADGTRFVWIMSGDGGFMGKLMNVLIDCEKMVTSDWDKGIESLKLLVEAQPRS